MNGNYSNIVLISGNSNIPLAQEISALLGIALAERTIKKFSDGETSVSIAESVRGKDVFIIQSTSAPVNDNLMEMLILMDALRRASASRINVVVPYYGYGRQDRKDKARVPITAKLVTDMMVVAGADRIITLDIHADQIQGFCNIPFDRMYGMPIIAKYYEKKYQGNFDNLVVVAPDVGSVKRSRMLAEKLNVPLAIIDKRRPKDNVAEVMHVMGDVVNKHVIMIDDMIDTGGTLMGAAKALHQMGALSVSAAATHGVMSGKCIENLQSDDIDELVVTNSINIPQEKLLDKVKVLSVGPLLAATIHRVHLGESISTLFENTGEGQQTLL